MLCIFVVISFSILWITNGVHIQDFENLKKCDIKDAECIPQFIEPAIQKWLLSGQSKQYNLSPLIPMIINEIDFFANGKMYTLKDINITGVKDCYLSNMKFAVQEKYYTFTHTINIVVYITSIIDEFGNIVNKDKPFVMGINNLPIIATYGYLLTQDSQNRKYFKFLDRKHFTFQNKGNVTIYSSMNIMPENESTIFIEQLKEKLAAVTHEEHMRIWSGFFDLVPVSNYLNV